MQEDSRHLLLPGDDQGVRVPDVGETESKGTQERKKGMGDIKTEKIFQLSHGTSALMGWCEWGSNSEASWDMPFQSEDQFTQAWG